MEAKKAEPRDSRTPSVIGGNAGMGRGMAAMQNPYAPGKVMMRLEHVVTCNQINTNRIKLPLQDFKIWFPLEVIKRLLPLRIIQHRMKCYRILKFLFNSVTCKYFNFEKQGYTSATSVTWLFDRNNNYSVNVGRN